MLTKDLHTHTLYSHGKGTPEENVLAAISCGLKTVAVSEHGPGHMFFGVRGRKLGHLRREMDRLKEKYSDKIEVLFGIESNLVGYGLTDIPKDLLDVFDVRLLAFHKGGRPSDGFGVARSLESLHLGGSDPVKTAEALLTAGEKYKIDIFAHPGLYVKCDIPTLARGAKELGIKLEINAARVTMSDEELRQAADIGAEFIIGSDAHWPSRVGDDALALAAAKRAGVEGSVVNIVR